MIHAADSLVSKIGWYRWFLMMCSVDGWAWPYRNGYAPLTFHK